jgi:hypothetical protein
MMRTRGLLVAGLLGLGACGATPASFGITGPGAVAPPTFKPAPVNDDSSVALPGIPNTGYIYSPSDKPAGDAAAPGSFYGYN